MKRKISNSKGELDITPFDYSQPFDVVLDEIISESGPIAADVVECIDCSMSLIQREIKEYRQQENTIRAAIAHGAAYRPGCVDPDVHDEIEHRQKLIEYLSEKREVIRTKGKVHHIPDNERWQYLVELGLLNSQRWIELTQTTSQDFRDKLIARILQIPDESARKLLDKSRTCKPSKISTIQETLNKGTF
jgi:hypothetical protein